MRHRSREPSGHLTPDPSAEPPPDPEARFTAFYTTVHADLVAFVQRRASGLVAEDVVAEAMTVVWRRLEQLPADHGDARAWAYGITRNVLLNQRRGDRRGEALLVRLAQLPTPDVTDTAEVALTRADLARAWTLLSAVQQEALALAVFEGLASPHAALVLGISPTAFRLRLSRARRALRLHLDHRPRATPSPAPPERSLQP